MQDGFVNSLRYRNPRVAALLNGPAIRALPRLPEPVLAHLTRDIDLRVSMLYCVVNGLELKSKPYALVIYPEFGAGATDKARLLTEVATGEFNLMTVEEARTAKPLKMLFLLYEFDRQKYKILICAAGDEYFDKPAKRAIVGKLAVNTPRIKYNHEKKVIGAFGMRTSDEILAEELGVVSGVLNPILSREKLAGVDAVLFTQAALAQGLSEVALTRLHGLITDSRELFRELSDRNPGKYHVLD